MKLLKIADDLDFLADNLDKKYYRNGEIEGLCLYIKRLRAIAKELRGDNTQIVKYQDHNGKEKKFRQKK